MTEASGCDDGDSKFVSVVRTKKNKNKITVRPEPKMSSFRSETNLSSPGHSCADLVRKLEQLSVRTNVCEKEREPPVPRNFITKTRVQPSLRPIVIDGSNVAYCHGRDREFSSKGIEIVVDDFLSRGHERIVVFLPQQRGRSRHDRELLEKLEEKCSLSFAPSRQKPSGEKISNHDDYYILNYAAMKEAVVVTRDNYRDHVNQKPEWDAVIRDRILMPTFVGDDIQWPEDPLGRNGPRLDEFLRF